MKFRLLTAVAMATVVAFGMSAAANASPAPQNAKSVTAVHNSGAVAAVAWPVPCPVGDVCFYTGSLGQGARCNWNIADPDWTTGTLQCSWATTTNVKSVWNNGTSGASGVTYYLGANFTGRIGCTRQQSRGDLAGTYKLRSHTWTSGACG